MELAWISIRMCHKHDDGTESCSDHYYSEPREYDDALEDAFQAAVDAAGCRED